MKGPCERCGNHGDALYRQVAGDPTWWDRMVCPRCVMLPPPWPYREPPAGCTRCGSHLDLSVETVGVGGDVVEIRLCAQCRYLAAAENQLAAYRRHT